MPHTPDNTYTYVAWAVLNRIAREAARFIERQEELLERSILSVLKCEFVPVTRAKLTTQLLTYLPTYLFFAVISRIKDRQKCDMLGGAAFKRRYCRCMMNIICFTPQNLQQFVKKKKPRPCARNFFFLLLFAVNLVLFKLCPRREFQMRNLKVFTIFNSSPTNKHAISCTT